MSGYNKKISLEKIANEIKQRVPNQYISSFNDPNDDSYRVINFTAYNDDISAGSFMDINTTANNFNFETAGSTLSIISDSAQDAPGGTGISSLFLDGLDTDYNRITEVVVTSGVTAVETTNTFLRLNVLFPLSSGTDNAAAGNINITGDGFTWATLIIGETNAHLGRYTVPAGKSFVGTVAAWSSDKTGEYEISFVTKAEGITEIEGVRLLLYQSIGDFRGFPTTSPAKTDLIMRVKKITGSGVLLVSGYSSGILFDNDLMNEIINR